MFLKVCTRKNCTAKIDFQESKDFTLSCSLLHSLPVGNPAQNTDCLFKDIRKFWSFFDEISFTSVQNTVMVVEPDLSCFCGFNEAYIIKTL